VQQSTLDEEERGGGEKLQEEDDDEEEEEAAAAARRSTSHRTGPGGGGGGEEEVVETELRLRTKNSFLNHFVSWPSFPCPRGVGDNHRRNDLVMMVVEKSKEEGIY